MGFDYSKCFAFVDNGCMALSPQICIKGEHCPFFKTKEQVQEEQKKTVERLTALGIYDYVKDRYYQK